MKKRTQTRVSVKAELTEGSVVKSFRTKLTRQSSLKNWVKKASDSKSFSKVESQRRFKAETPANSKTSSEIPVISLDDTDEESSLLNSGSKPFTLTPTLVKQTKLESLSLQTASLKKNNTAQFTDDNSCKPSTSLYLINESSDDDFESVPSWKFNKKTNSNFSGALNNTRGLPKILFKQIRKKASTKEKISAKVIEENTVFEDAQKNDNFLGDKFSKKASVHSRGLKPKCLKPSLLSLKSQASNSKPGNFLDTSTQSDTIALLKSEPNLENPCKEKNGNNNKATYSAKQSLAEALFSDSDELDEPDPSNMDKAHTFLKPKDKLSSDLFEQSESLPILPETNNLDFHSADDLIVQMFRQQFMGGKPARKRRIFSDCQEEEILVVDMDRAQIMKAPLESKKRPAAKKRGGRAQRAQQESTFSTNDASSSRPTLKQLYYRAKANGRYNKELYASLKKEHGYNNVKRPRSRHKGKSKKRKT